MRLVRFVCIRCRAVTDVFFYLHETPPEECSCAYCHGVAKKKSERDLEEKR